MQLKLFGSLGELFGSVRVGGGSEGDRIQTLTLMVAKVWTGVGSDRAVFGSDRSYKQRLRTGKQRQHLIQQAIRPIKPTVPPWQLMIWIVEGRNAKGKLKRDPSIAKLR